MQKGNISIQAENIFPIIKKFLYSEHDIFLRELISNAIDATNKLKTLASKGEFKGKLGDTTIEVSVDKKKKTITFKDKGIGMTAEEVEKYLNQMAFSSAQEFLEKYKDDANIIGHFGLGFYSAFMVADKVEVFTKSHKKGSKAVHWVCEGEPEYQIGEADKKDRGTEIILHISKDSKEFLEDNRIDELLHKYCKFLPVPIKFGTKTETTYEGEGDDAKEIKTEVDNIINNTDPAWNKKPADLSDEDYRNFYNELYPYSQPPMFWIHLNVDHPFKLTGILYFPKLNNSFEVQKNKIQLYSNQVFVTDEVKEIVPEFLTLLHGVIDSPDIPLNVSRSYLQGDPEVRKISSYITRKVAEKLKSLFKKDRESFEAKWADLNVFVKYGMISEEKFYDKGIDFALLTNTEKKYFTIEEYKEQVKATQTDKHDKIIMLYTNNVSEHHSLISACQDKGYDVLLFDNIIDNHFMQQLEYKLGDVTFVRVDSDTVDNLIQKDENRESVLSEDEQTAVKTVFESFVTPADGTIMLKAMGPEDQPVQITQPEFMRRMKEMQQLQGMGLDGFPGTFNVVVNTNHPLISGKLIGEKDESKQKDIAEYLYNLALLNQNMLKGPKLTAFIKRSMSFMGE
ncbi:MAG: molecular chaperone HtpG [Saprospiraceae bacterium]|nr:molecular chaperone HtpG [Saprospiraceae bacterium]MCB9324272.1 molecular chaperone HtpG [Lewinellaceae bacterium]